jgi:hypothetical protein
MERPSDDLFCRRVDGAFLRSACASLAWSERVVIAAAGGSVLILLSVLHALLLMAAYPSDALMLMASFAWSAMLSRAAGDELARQRQRGASSAWIAVLPEQRMRGRHVASERIERRRRAVVGGAVVACGLVAAWASVPSVAWVFTAAGLLGGAILGSLGLGRSPADAGRDAPRIESWTSTVGDALAHWTDRRRHQRARLWRDTLAVGAVQLAVTLVASVGGVPILPEATCVALVGFFSVRHVDPSFLAALPLRVLPRSRGAWATAVFGRAAWGHVLPPLVLWIVDPSHAHAFFAVVVVAATTWSILCRIALAERSGVALGFHMGAAAVVATLGAVSWPLLLLHAVWCVRRWRR